MEHKLSERLRELRAEKRISQAKLAKILNVDISFIAQIELGKSLVSINMLIALARHFNVSTDYLLGLTDF